MGVVAGLLGLLYAGLHGAGTGQVARDDRIPRWAALGWIVACALVAIASVVLLVTSSGAVVALLALGLLGVAGLAVANGVWMHGRPNLSHHVVRGAFAVIVLIAAVLSID